MLTVAFHHCMLPFAISAIIHPLPSPTSPGRTFLRANNAPPRALSPFVRSPAQRWKKSSSLNLEQSRPTSYGILLFYNCVLDYDKGHQTGEGGVTFSSSPPFLFSPPSFSFSHSYSTLISISVLSLDRVEQNGTRIRVRVFPLSFSIPFNPPSLPELYIRG